MSIYFGEGDLKNILMKPKAFGLGLHRYLIGDPLKTEALKSLYQFRSMYSRKRHEVSSG